MSRVLSWRPVDHGRLLKRFRLASSFNHHFTQIIERDGTGMYDSATAVEDVNLPFGHALFPPLCLL